MCVCYGSRPLCLNPNMVLWLFGVFYCVEEGFHDFSDERGAEVFFWVSWCLFESCVLVCGYAGAA